LTNTIQCIRCKTPMEDGFVADVADWGYRQQVWHPGEPKLSWATGLKMKKELCANVLTLRCPKCGYLESYAAKQGV